MRSIGDVRRAAGGALLWFLVFVAAAAIVLLLLLLGNIGDRKEEAKQVAFKLVDLTEETLDPAEWGKNFPRQYDSYKRTVDTERTKHGGSEAFQKLDDDVRWRVLFSGYAFGVDYREERGHAYMLTDQRETERVTQFKQPGACLHCHAAVTQAYFTKGVEAGAPAADRKAAIQKGFEVVCEMPYGEATKLVEHPVACVDCHDPASMQLRVTRPGFLNGIVAFANSDQPAPHLPSIERWRTGNRKTPYDPNVDGSRQELRAMVCGQCHVEYYFKPPHKTLTYPWALGLRMEQIEAYYDEVGWTDWKHKITGAPTLKAQHPEFEMWSQGIHARSGVTCADCHMPYMREGAIKVSDHHVRSPMLNIARACQTCHRYPEDEIRSRVETIQDRTKALMTRAEEATVALCNVIEKARTLGATDEQLGPALKLHRKAEWRLDFVAAENSMGFHAPQEAARILAESADDARQGIIEVAKVKPDALK